MLVFLIAFGDIEKFSPFVMEIGTNATIVVSNKSLRNKENGEPDPIDEQFAISEGQNATTEAIAPETSLNFTLPSLEGQKYLMVHIGKTAGSSVVCELGKRYPSCKNAPLKARPSSLGLHLADATHMERNVNKVMARAGHYDLFLVVLRNPLGRLLSWFAYEHPASTKAFGPGKACSKQFYKTRQSPNGCFATLQEFAGNVTLPTTDTTTSWCQTLAWKVATGQRLCYGHNALNFQFYWKLMKELEPALEDNVEDNPSITDGISSEQPTVPSSSSSFNKPIGNQTRARIVSIRTEHLASDWDVLEAMFGGMSSNISGQERFEMKRNKTPPRPALQFVDDAGRQNLCTALCPEMQVYKILLQRSFNLQPADIATSLQEVQAVCPNETIAIRSCGPKEMFGEGLSIYYQ